MSGDEEIKGTEQSRSIALALAVLKHSADNLVEGAIPASPKTIVSTADRFNEYINEGLLGEARRR